MILVIDKCGEKQRGSGRDNLWYCRLIDAMIKYQKAVKGAVVKYFSHLINRNPRNPSITTGLDITRSTCENFLLFFINKLEALRASISSPDLTLDYIFPISFRTWFERVWTDIIIRFGGFSLPYEACSAPDSTVQNQPKCQMICSWPPIQESMQFGINWSDSCIWH